MPGRDLPDLEQRLRRLPAALAVEAPAGLAERVARRGRGRRRLRRATAAVVVVALLGGAVAIRSAVLDRSPTPTLSPGLLAEQATPEQLAAGRWQALAELPPGPGRLTRRLSPVVVWTGQELLVWGGTSRDPFRVHADGAAYDPRTKRWTPLPPAPEAQWLDSDRGRAVWTGRELLVWGGITIPDPVGAPNSGRPADGVAYDPARRSWRRLPARPAELEAVRSDRLTVWTGRELLVVGVQEAGAGGGAAAAAYDPAANHWRRLPQSPALTGGSGHLLARTAMWAGSRLLVWSSWSRTSKAANDLSGAVDTPDSEPDGIDLWAYEPSGDRWTVLPAPPVQVRQAVAGGSMVWTGRDVLVGASQIRVVDGRRRTVTLAGLYDPDGARWTPVAAPPRPGGRLRLEWSGSAAVEPLRGAVYDPAADRWLRLPAGPATTSPPRASWGPERALLRTRERATGAIQVHVLVPERPAARP